MIFKRGQIYRHVSEKRLFLLLLEPAEQSEEQEKAWAIHTWWINKGEAVSHHDYMMGEIQLKAGWLLLVDVDI